MLILYCNESVQILLQNSRTGGEYTFKVNDRLIRDNDEFEGCKEIPRTKTNVFSRCDYDGTLSSDDEEKTLPSEQHFLSL